MKIKVTVYTLASDTRDGTDCEVFGSEAELNAALVLIIEEKLDRGYEHTDEIKEHIKAGEIDEAWALFEDYIRNPEDTYCQGEHEIEVEPPGIGFALDACRALVRTVEATGGTVQHKDGTEGPEADPDWIDLADAYRTAKQAIALHEHSPAPTVSA